MAREKIGIEFDPVITAKVDAALSNIKSKAKQVDFSGGAASLNKLTRPLGKITGQADEFRKSLEASNARVLAFGASVAVINKLSQAFGALVSNTIKVEATFAKINTILGGTEKQIKQFGSGIFDVAKNTGTAFDQVAEGALELARQGLSVEQSLERVSVALKLVRVAGIDSQKAVSGITAAFKGFEGSGLTVAQIGDRLSQVDTKFATSTESLIEGLKRSSSSARAAGVSFNELLAIVTTVEERTQRGGAVIGNAFKTIFTRTKRADVLSTFDELGIAVLDSEKKIRPFIPLMEDLKKKVEELGGVKSLEGSAILEKVAGARQIENLLTLFEDLGNEGSKFTQVLEVIGGSVGSLDAKNEALNVTLEALINNVKISAQEFSSILGDIGFADAAKDLLRTVSGAIEKVSTLLQGDSVGSKFAKGIVSGIGAVLTGPGLALVGAIFVKLFVDLTKFGVTSLKSLLGVNKAAQQQSILQKSILQTLLQNEDIQRRVLSLSGDKAAQELALLKIYNQQAASLARVQQVAATVTPALFGAGLRGGESGVRKPGGRAADGYVSAESRDVSRGVGGAPSSSKVVSIPNFAFGGGKRGTMVANSSEYFVPNYAGGGDAIFNRNMVRTMGLPSGAKKINAAGGFIPNFAKKQQKSNGKPPIYNSKYAMVVPIPGGSPRQTALAKSGQSYQFDVFGYSKTNLKSKNQDELIKDVKDFGINLAKREALTMTNGEPTPESKTKLGNAGSVSSLAGVIFEAAISSLLKSPEFDGGQTATFDFIGDRAIEDLSGLFPSLTDQKFVEAKIGVSPDINKSMANKIEKFSGGGNRISKDASGEIKAAKVRAGGVFSASGQKKEFGPTKRSSRGFIPNFAGDGFLNKTVTTALEDAISREKAAGLSVNQIRINQSGKLRNSRNPQGLAVTNTRDEPTGRIPSGRSAGGFIPNFASPNDSPEKSLERVAKSGDKLNKSNTSQLGTILALQTVSYGLSSAFGTITDESSGFARRLSDAADATQVFITALISLQTVGLLGGDAKAAFAKIASSLLGVGRLKSGAKALKAGFGAGKAATATGVGKGGIALAAGVFSKKATSTAGAGVLKTLFKVGAGFSRFLPVIGPLILGFTALNGLIKVAFGTSGIGLITSAFGKSAKASEQAALSASNLAKSLTLAAEAGDVAKKQRQIQEAERQTSKATTRIEVLQERKQAIEGSSRGFTVSKGGGGAFAAGLGNPGGITPGQLAELKEINEELDIQEETLEKLEKIKINLNIGIDASVLGSYDAATDKVLSIRDLFNDIKSSAQESFLNSEANQQADQLANTFRQALTTNQTLKTVLSLQNDELKAQADFINNTQKNLNDVKDTVLDTITGLDEQNQIEAELAAKFKAALESATDTQGIQEAVNLLKKDEVGLATQLTVELDSQIGGYQRANVEAAALLAAEEERLKTQRNITLEQLKRQTVETKVEVDRVVAKKQGRNTSEISQITSQAKLNDLLKEKDDLILEGVTLTLKQNNIDSKISSEAKALLAINKEGLKVVENKLFIAQTNSDILKGDVALNATLVSLQSTQTANSNIRNLANAKANGLLDQQIANSATLTSAQLRTLELKKEELSFGEQQADIEDKKKVISQKLASANLTQTSLTNEQIKALEDQLSVLENQSDVLEVNLETVRNIKNEADNVNFTKGLNIGLASLKDKVDNFKLELGTEVPLKFSENLGTALIDAVSGAKDLDDALSDAGRNFLGYMRDAFLQQAAAQATTGLFDGVKKVSGGIKDIFGIGSPSSTSTPANGVSGGTEAAKSGAEAGVEALKDAACKKPCGTKTDPLYVVMTAAPSAAAAAGDKADQLQVGGAGQAPVGADGEPTTAGENGFFTNLKTKFTNVFSTVKGKLGTIFSALGESMGTIFGALKENLGGIFQNIMGMFGGGGGGGGGGGFGGILKAGLGIVTSLFSPGAGSAINGAVGAAPAGMAFAANGGLIGYAGGGSVSPIARGGPMSSTDTVPAMLTPGEFVVKRSAVEQYGTEFLSSLNDGALPMKRFQQGGAVSSVSPIIGGSAGGSSVSNQVSNSSEFVFNIKGDGSKSEDGSTDNGTPESQTEFANKVRSAVTTVIQEESRTGGTLSYLYK
mgnify:CR=1 FL=1